MGKIDNGSGRVDGDKLWLKDYKYIVSLRLLDGISDPHLRANVESGIQNELSRLRSASLRVVVGWTHKVPGTNTLFILRSGKKVLLHEDNEHMGDSIYYEDERDCRCDAYKKWRNIASQSSGARDIMEVFAEGKKNKVAMRKELKPKHI